MWLYIFDEINCGLIETFEPIHRRSNACNGCMRCAIKLPDIMLYCGRDKCEDAASMDALARGMAGHGHVENVRTSIAHASAMSQP